MKAKNNTLDGMDKWIKAIHSGKLLNPTENQTQFDCPRCALLRMEVKRLKWLIQNMMTAVGDIEEFGDGANNT